MGSEVVGFPAVVDVANVRVQTRVLAYLGQLKPDSFVSARRLCYDLSLRFTTAKNVLTTLEHRKLVEKKISNRKGVVAEFRIHRDATVRVWDNETGVEKMVPFVPPDWEPAYGRYPDNL